MRAEWRLKWGGRVLRVVLAAVGVLAAFKVS